MGIHPTNTKRNELTHYGTPRHSGRYPWGSGKNPQRNKDFISYVDSLRKQGMTDTQIAEGMGMKTPEFRARMTILKSQIRQENVAEALRLKDKGMSTSAIGRQMGVNESTVRSWLDPAIKERAEASERVAELLKQQIKETGGYLDVGAGVERYMGVSRTKFDTAVAMLKEEGYEIRYDKVEQLGNPGNFTSMKVLVPPGVSYKDYYANRELVSIPNHYSEDGGDTFKSIQSPRQLDSSRIQIRYSEDGGNLKDGVIELRRGVDELSLGDSRYAQVRIGVDGTHYLKGMAVYSDDMPKGVDIIFNTNKSKELSKMEVLKKNETKDEDLPFGAIVRQKTYIDKDGKEQLSALNIVGYKDTSGEEGAWGEWSRNLSSQMLSKQSPDLVKRQLDLAYATKMDEFSDIMAITNPAVKKSQLESFADDCDASATHLKAAALPRQRTHVILPVNSLKETEVYAPNYKNGEKVILIRYPHGGIFEIPELTVNNKNREGVKLLGSAEDGIGINKKVADQLSGADFDGDTVLVIPNKKGINIKTSAPLQSLKDFDPKEAYKLPKEGAPYKVTDRIKQQQMGQVSNLITDMTIKGANTDEIARAVKHSMVVIDSYKHQLDYKQSAIDNGISQLKEKYQGGKQRGASTLISKSNSEVDVPLRKPRSYADGGPIDPKTGKKMWTYTGESYVDKKGKTVTLTTKSKKGMEEDDVFNLSSGTKVESIYATYANRMKALANQSRKESLVVKPTPISQSAKTVYKKEADSLSSKLAVALKNSPLERRAQLLANIEVQAKRKANPDLDKSDLKKIKNQALATARARTGAKKNRVSITDREWEAIQAGAISQSKLSQILANADQDRIKTLAMPRSSTGLSSAKASRAKSMIASGYTQAEVAEALGVSVTTVLNAIK